MKIKYIAAVILTILFIAGRPVNSLADEGAYETILGDADVICTVQEKYDFTVPDDAVLNYPQTSMYLGEFVIGDILLRAEKRSA